MICVLLTEIQSSSDTDRSSGEKMHGPKQGADLDYHF